MEYFAANIGNSKGAKSISLGWVKSLNRSDKSHIANLFKVFKGLTTLAGDPMSDLAH
jgi:hypothetical protein